ncbi:peptidase S8/S53 domain-containing protein [Catenaria anguillulae PL171]|uniref:Peptidase S8/S53 domain-containing protein n=1 Tax=Catenaria anguillulae PL171 TaxID=765915 RepID=A0A1Y2HHL4_9FUNG|nr:peptidase S8/S53 domain-containing protein [Catenaria anguillulae PL171]
MVRKLKSNSQVAHVEPDYVLKACETTQLNPPNWGLSFISRRFPGKGNYYFPDKQGQGVDVYILDSGIATNHTEFTRNRAHFAFNGDATWPWEDDMNHGTTVAGIIAGSTYGVAKRATVHALKVLDKNGAGTMSTALRAMEWVAEAVRKSGKTSVCNFSFVALNLDDTVNADLALAGLAEAGCVIVKAAGDERGDACKFWPNGSRVGLTVSSLAVDGRSHVDGTNFGPCVQRMLSLSTA